MSTETSIFGRLLKESKGKPFPEAKVSPSSHKKKLLGMAKMFLMARGLKDKQKHMDKAMAYCKKYNIDFNNAWPGVKALAKKSVAVGQQGYSESTNVADWECPNCGMVSTGDALMNDPNCPKCGKAIEVKREAYSWAYGNGVVSYDDVAADYDEISMLAPEDPDKLTTDPYDDADDEYMEMGEAMEDKLAILSTLGDAVEEDEIRDSLFGSKESLSEMTQVAKPSSGGGKTAVKKNPSKGLKQGGERKLTVKRVAMEMKRWSKAAKGKVRDVSLANGSAGVFIEYLPAKWFQVADYEKMIIAKLQSMGIKNPKVKARTTGGLHKGYMIDLSGKALSEDIDEEAALKIAESWTDGEPREKTVDESLKELHSYMTEDEDEEEPIEEVISGSTKERRSTRHNEPTFRGHTRDKDRENWRGAKAAEVRKKRKEKRATLGHKIKRGLKKLKKKVFGRKRESITLQGITDSVRELLQDQHIVSLDEGMDGYLYEVSQALDIVNEFCLNLTEDEGNEDSQP